MLPGLAFLLPLAEAGAGWLETLERKIMHLVTCHLHGDTLGPLFSHVQSDKLGIPLILVTLTLYGGWRPRRALRAVLAIGVGVGVGMLVVGALWALIDRKRPPLHYEHLLQTPAERATCADHPEALAVRSHISKRASFPSRHALTVGVAVTVFWFAARWLGLLATVYGALVVVGRVYIAKHWPSDMLVGCALGAVLGWLAWRQLPELLRRLHRERLAAYLAGAGGSEGTGTGSAIQR